MNTQDLICYSIGACSSDCEFIDELCEKFDQELSEQMILYAVQQSDGNVANFLINLIFDRVIWSFRDEFPEYNIEDLFNYQVNCRASFLSFNGKQVYNNEDVRDEIMNWILEGQQS